MTNDNIDAVAAALQNEPAFKDGGHEGKIGYYFIRLFKMDWPVKNADVRASWDLDPKQDTDGDGTPDADDEDIDGDGVKNHNDKDIDGDGVENSEDNSPYDSTKQFKLDETLYTDEDGVPDIFDAYPEDPDRNFVSKRLRKMKNTIVRSVW